MGPNKYKQNEKIRPDTLLRTITSTVTMLLIVLGLIGITLTFFKNDGLLGDIASYIFQSTQHLLLIPLIIFALWLLNRWFSSPKKDEKKQNGNLPMYIMVLVGLYYAYKLITTGRF